MMYRLTARASTHQYELMGMQMGLIHNTLRCVYSGIKRVHYVGNTNTMQNSDVIKRVQYEPSTSYPLTMNRRFLSDFCWGLEDYFVIFNVLPKDSQTELSESWRQLITLRRPNTDFYFLNIKLTFKRWHM